MIFMQRKFSSLKYLAVVFLLVFLYSCSINRRFSENVIASKDKERGNFIETVEGEIIEGEDLNIRYPFFKKPFVEINSEVVKLKDVLVIQNNYGYYRKINGQLAPRVKKGLLNMYMTTETYQEFQTSSVPGSTGRWRTRTRYVYWIQKGDKNGVELFSAAVLRKYVSDYRPALDYMDEYDRKMKTVRTWSWINTAAVVGGLVLAGSSGIDENDDVTVAGYAGLGLFVGGLANGVVNKIKRVKTHKNLELAFDEYNRQVRKK